MSGGGQCFLCGEKCDEGDFCFGCGVHVCDECDVVACFGTHEPHEHQELEDYHMSEVTYDSKANDVC